MSFTENSFFFFVIIFTIIFHARVLPKPFLILVGSYIFYAYWDWRFLALLIALSIVNFYSAILMKKLEGKHNSNILLSITLIFNLGILGLFKYFNFFSEGISILLNTLGFKTSVPTLDLLIPLGISFYVFQISSYIIDVKRGRLEPTRDLVAFSAFASYFPHMAAGPIMPAKQLIPQIQEAYKVLTPNELCSAFALITSGLVRKIVIADTLAPMVNRVYESPEQFDWKVLLLATLAFSLQIYGDFSGYSNIARGVSRLLGIELIVNFSQPYFSPNVQVFWRRWHISLSQWFKDYLYIPMGGNRRGKIRNAFNLMFVMLVAGLWHGASFGFIIWGLFHGLALVLHSVFKRLKIPNLPELISKVMSIFSIILTFVLVTLLWIPFRLPDTDSFVDYFRRILISQQGIFDLSDLLLVLQMLALSIVLDAIERTVKINFRGIQDLIFSHKTTLGFVIGITLTLAFIYRSSVVVPFIYFQF